MGIREGTCRPPRGEHMVFRKEEWALRRTDGSVIVCVSGVWCPLLVFLPVMSHLVGETLQGGRGSTIMKFLLEELSLGSSREFRESLNLCLLFFKCLRLRRIKMLIKWHILRWHIMLPFSTIYQNWKCPYSFTQQFSFPGFIIPLVSYMCEIS